ncbi:hypothetical protein B0H15DRAFT_441566 [Mycena belliarum]|uniref:SH3 domain-containing protein n=1 Tax=Mycena belliarum TaxID=1033014 RepID=A0AAD6TYY9_9AGAR|nr:hypothetical protein B0H15DRAFT_441566 [Mycena belliae]
MSLRLDFRPFHTHYFFLFTTLLSVIAWVVTLVGQAVATAKFGNRAVGARWFSILLQGFLTLGVVATIATDSLATNRLQLATFGAIALIFAVQGVQLGIMDGAARPALVAMGAGSLVLAVVDIMWVLYFTSEEDSLALHLFSRLGTGGLTPAHRRRTMTEQPASGLGKTTLGDGEGERESGSAKQGAKLHDAHGGSGPPARNGSSRAVSISSFKSLMGGGAGAGAQRKSYALGAGVSSEDVRAGAQGLARSGTGGRSIASRKSLLSLATHAESDEGTVPPMPVSDASRAPVPGTAAGAGAPVSLPSPQNSAPSIHTSALRMTDEEGEPMLLAKALHAYKGSPEDPNELSFAKGEILEIEDKEGRWWQAKKADGTLGIVPSNDLLLI